MRRILRNTACGQPVSRLIRRLTTLAVAFLFVIPFTAHANTTDSTNTVSTTASSETGEVDEPGSPPVTGKGEPTVKFLKDVAPILGDSTHNLKVGASVS
jgi:hypothetical protein